MNFTDCHFSLPSLFHSLPLPFLNYIENTYGKKLPIGTIYGSLLTRWNGGRTTGAFRLNDEKRVTEYIDETNSLGINTFFTFTNSYIDSTNISDYVGNFLLDTANKPNVGNGVILTSDYLFDYIKDKYPNLKTKSSILKVTNDLPHKRTASYYNSLTDRFDKVVLHPDDNKDYALIESLNNINKIEVLLDERCTYNCSIRKHHYDLVAMGNNATTDTEQELYFGKEVDLYNNLCPREKVIQGLALKTKQDKGFIISTQKDVDNLYSLGVRNFKLSGRSPNSEEAVRLPIIKMISHVFDDDWDRQQCLYLL